MIITNTIEELKKNLKGRDVNVTIGNFDGVHLGHRDFLSKIKDESNNLNRKFLAITFIPHPVFVLNARPHFLINTYVDRRKLLQDMGVDFLLEVDFTRDFSTLSPKSFFEKFIFSIPEIKKIFLGHDFHFGANKEGDFKLAQEIAKNHQVELVLHNEFKVSTSPVSSTAIRHFIQNGNVEEAHSMLGREYFLTGRVIKGQGRGRQIGFPTANLGYDKDLILPSKGVYISKTQVNGMLYESITNVGVNPTFNTGYEIHVETHILGFSRDIYGDEICVKFIKKLRDEKKFSSVNELVTQISLDLESAKRFFENA